MSLSAVSAWGQAREAVCPAVFAFVSCGLGVLAAAVLRSPDGSLFIGFLLLSAALCLVLCCVRRRLLVAVCCCLGLALGWLRYPFRESDLERAAGGFPATLDLRGVVVSAPVPEPITGPRNRVRFEVEVAALRTVFESRWQAGRARLVCFSEGPQVPGYGSRVRVRGVVSRPEGAVFPGEFDYARYLALDGVDGICSATAWASLAGGVSLPRRPLAALFRLRNRMALILADGIPDDRARGLVVALCLGLREAVEGYTRLTFLRSGAIHVFAISGLHVGILAGLWLLLSRPVPFRCRYALLPVVIGVYVLMSGSACSAVRAWLMLSTWAVAKACLMALVPMNAVALAGLLILLVRPYELFTAGFQFSFAIVLALVLAWPRIRDLVSLVCERDNWLPPERRNSPGARLRRRVLRGCLQAGGVGLTACLASTPLSVLYNGLLIPGGVVLNPLVSVLAWGILGLSVLKLLLVHVGFHVLIVPLLDRLLTVAGVGICAATDVWAHSAGTVSVRALPPVPACLAYSGVVGLLVWGHRRPLRWGLGLGLGLLWFWGLAPRPCPDLRLALFSGGYGEGPGVVVAPRSGESLVVAGGGMRAARHAVAWLNSTGRGTLAGVVSPGRRRSIAYSQQYVLENLPVRTLVREADATGAKALPGRTWWPGMAIGAWGKGPGVWIRVGAFRVRRFHTGSGWCLDVEAPGPERDPIRFSIEQDWYRGMRVTTADRKGEWLPFRSRQRLVSLELDP